MKNNPTIEFHADTQQEIDDGVLWLIRLIASVEELVRQADDMNEEVCYWPGALERLTFKEDVLTVEWRDIFDHYCFRALFQAALDADGKSCDVVYLAPDDPDEIGDPDNHQGN